MERQGSTAVARRLTVAGILAAMVVAIRGGMGLAATFEPLPWWQQVSAAFLELAERMV